MVTKNAKILVIDDEQDVRKLLQARLTKRGYQVVATKGAEEFKKCAFVENPDLLIVDILLGNDGIGTDVYDEIVRMGFDREIPVIFISALVDAGWPPRHVADRRKMILYGKPFDFDSFCKDIDQMLSEYQRK